MSSYYNELSYIFQIRAILSEPPVIMNLLSALIAIQRIISEIFFISYTFFPEFILNKINSWLLLFEAINLLSLLIAILISHKFAFKLDSTRFKFYKFAFLKLE